MGEASPWSLMPFPPRSLPQGSKSSSTGVSWEKKFMGSKHSPSDNLEPQSLTLTSSCSAQISLHRIEPVQFSRSAVSDSLWPHGLQHTRLPCPSPTPGACSNSCPLSRWCHPTISSSVVPFSCLQSFPASGSFQKESVLLIRWPKYWSFSFSISPSNEYSALISFRMDWLDLLAVQGTLKSLLQHHSSKASVLQRAAFFMVHLSHPYMTTGKTTVSARCTFVDKVSNWKEPLGSFCYLRRNTSLNGLREIVKDREAWGTAVYGVTKSQTWLSDWTTTGQRDIPSAIFLLETNDKPKVLWLLLSPTKTSYLKDLLFCL